MKDYIPRYFFLLVFCFLFLQCKSSEITMEKLNNGFIPEDSLYYFQYPIMDLKAKEIQISEIIKHEDKRDWIVCVSAPGC